MSGAGRTIVPLTALLRGVIWLCTPVSWLLARLLPARAWGCVFSLWCPLGCWAWCLVDSQMPVDFFPQKLHMTQLLSSYSEAYPKTRICDEFEISLYSFTFKTLCYREFKTSVRVDKSKMDPHSSISPVSTIINFPASLISSECPYPTSF